MEAHFIKDLGLDSLDVVEIIMAFEEELSMLLLSCHLMYSNLFIRC